jgi:hypothetical protein
VTQTIPAGTRTASVADLPLTAVPYSHAAQSQTGTMTLEVDDSSGSGAGWNVTIQSSAFVYSGGLGGTNIPAANFSITGADAPVFVAGQAIDTVDPQALNGPMVPSTSPVGALNTSPKVLQANTGYGAGSYTQDIDVSLAIPALSRAGTYTGTPTTTVAAAPS